jgi:hypothetical protein
MKAYTHARRGKSGPCGLQVLAEEKGRRRNALALAGRSVGRFKKGPKDLSANRKHLKSFGD